MDSKKTPLQRAFEMARSGACMGLADLIRDLNKEGYDCRQVEGPSLKKQLSALIKERKATDVSPARRRSARPRRSRRAGSLTGEMR